MIPIGGHEPCFGGIHEQLFVASFCKKGTLSAKDKRSEQTFPWCVLTVLQYSSMLLWDEVIAVNHFTINTEKREFLIHFSILCNAFFKMERWQNCHGILIKRAHYIY